MPLPPPAAREHYHTRRITCEGFCREDGLWDIEGHITDVKSYAFDNAWRGTIEPGTAIHEMWLRLTLDDEMTVHDVEAATDNSPFEICSSVTGNFKRLIGLKIGAGWNRRVKEVLGGVEGCTHLVELLGPMATVAFQTLQSGTRRRDFLLGKADAADGESPDNLPPKILDTCRGWDRTGPVVKQFLPQHYVEREDKP